MSDNSPVQILETLCTEKGREHVRKQRGREGGGEIGKATQKKTHTNIEEQNLTRFFFRNLSQINGEVDKKKSDVGEIYAER